jgi:hypothetical protein
VVRKKSFWAAVEREGHGPASGAFSGARRSVQLPDRADI